MTGLWLKFAIAAERREFDERATSDILVESVLAGGFGALDEETGGSPVRTSMPRHSSRCSSDSASRPAADAPPQSLDADQPHGRIAWESRQSDLAAKGAVWQAGG